MRHNILIFNLRLTAAFTTKINSYMDIDYWQIHMFTFFAHVWLVHIKGLNIVLRKKEEEEKENHQCWQTPCGGQM